MAEQPAISARSRRLESLDVLRGLTIIGMVIANASAGLYYDQQIQVFPLVLHSHWDGLTFADIVFPGFLTMMGISIPLALGIDRSGRGMAPGDLGKIGGRVARLLLLGFILSNIYWFADFSSGSWRLFGVLQRIGLCYGAAAILFLQCSPRTRLILAAALLVLYWPVTMIPTLDGIPTNLWLRGENFVGSVDRLLLGAGNHIYVPGPEGYDPEGLLGTLPAIAQALIGVAIGEYLARHRERESWLPLALAGIAMIAVGAVWSFGFPVIKDIWSSSFVLVTTGITALALGLLHLWLDNRDARAIDGAARVLKRFAVVFGANAIAAYTLHEVTSGMISWQLITLPYHWTVGALGPGLAALLPVAVYIGFLWICMDYFLRRGWIFKV
ncbi:acyltransferase family protein [Sphingosinithalassobacter portus]|uniref:acyltransferase family protein n=1 Tax=Stakelama portus TaxID=2676234 RepID=UPI000D6E7695|nr:heparan-alpha-glucosaminide N-acetyltransferase domain-containing protein [Sphingosinithalassobacter portus]